MPNGIERQFIRVVRAGAVNGLESSCPDTSSHRPRRRYSQAFLETAAYVGVWEDHFTIRRMVSDPNRPQTIRTTRTIEIVRRRQYDVGRRRV